MDQLDFHHGLAKAPWASHLVPLHLSFLVCNMGTRLPHTALSCGQNEITTSTLVITSLGNNVPGPEGRRPGILRRALRSWIQMTESSPQLVAHLPGPAVPSQERRRRGASTHLRLYSSRSRFTLASTL